MLVICPLEKHMEEEEEEEDTTASISWVSTN
jgi:hypothetical protein